MCTFLILRKKRKCKEIQGPLPRGPEKSLADQPIISLDSPGFGDITLSQVALHDDESFFRVEPS